MRFTAPKLGDVLAKKFRIAEARTTKASWQDRLVEVARQLGADLTKPEDFRMVDELVRGR
ncbi:MAG: hypothetical protein AAB974_01505 [Patescibacteria group bacterium]